jgi:hypothetical protein
MPNGTVLTMIAGSRLRSGFDGRVRVVAGVVSFVFVALLLLSALVPQHDAGAA